MQIVFNVNVNGPEELEKYLALLGPLNLDSEEKPKSRKKSKEVKTEVIQTPEAITSVVSETSATETATTIMQKPLAEEPLNVVPTTPVVPVTQVAPQYTREQLAVAMASLMDVGKDFEYINNILTNNFGVDNLMALDPAHYGALATILMAEGVMV